MCICTNKIVKIMCFLSAQKLIKNKNQSTESIEAFLINVEKSIASLFDCNEPKIINFRFEIYVLPAVVLVSWFFSGYLEY